MTSDEETDVMRVMIDRTAIAEFAVVLGECLANAAVDRYIERMTESTDMSSLERAERRVIECVLPWSDHVSRRVREDWERDLLIAVREYRLERKRAEENEEVSDV